jgi:hypothetical protein
VGREWGGGGVEGGLGKSRNAATCINNAEHRELNYVANGGIWKGAWPDVRAIIDIYTRAAHCRDPISQSRPRAMHIFTTFGASRRRRGGGRASRRGSIDGKRDSCLGFREIASGNRLPFIPVDDPPPAASGRLVLLVVVLVVVAAAAAAASASASASSARCGASGRIGGDGGSGSGGGEGG